MGDMEGPLITLETLCYLERLEELDLSNFKASNSGTCPITGLTS